MIVSGPSGYRVFLASAAPWLLCAAIAAAQPYAQPLGSGAVRFFESEAAFKAAPPSFALERIPIRQFPMPEGWSITPEYSTVDGKHTVRVPIPDGASLYGLGAEPGPLLRNNFHSKGQPVECPWVMAVRPDGSAFGALADTTWTCSVDLTRAIEFRSEAPNLSVVVITAPDPEALLRALNGLTGRMEMPPRWALGATFQAGLVGSDLLNEEDVRRLAAFLREHQIPADSLSYLGTGDLALTNGPVADPSRLLADLHALGFHAVVHTPIFVFAQPGHSLYDSGQRAQVWVSGPNGSPAGTAEQPPILLPDYSKASVRAWWSEQVFEAAKSGVDAVVLTGLGGRVPEDAIIDADPDFGGRGEWKNLSSLARALAAKATYEGFHASERDRRPVVESPAGRPGSQRWGAAEHEHPRHKPYGALKNALSEALSGHPLNAAALRTGDRDGPMPIGPDIAALRVECWIWPNAANPTPASEIQRLKAALQQRSRLIPYYYTLCFNAFAHCDPILRPVFFADPTDPALRSIDSMFLAGRDLCVIPRLAADARKPKPPLKGAWRKIDFADGDNPDLPDLYVRPGAILPLGPIMQHTGEKPVDPLTLVINLDPEGAAVGELYEDDGDGYAFYHNGCRRMVYRATTEGGSVFVRLATLDGGMPIPKRKVEIRILTDGEEVTGTGSERGTIKIDLPAPKKP